MIIKKDYEIVKAKGERKSTALKAKKESSDEECLTSESENEEYTMAVKDFKKKYFRCSDPNHLIGECPKPQKHKNQRAFVEGSCSDSGEEDDEKVKDETCLVARASSEVFCVSSFTIYFVPTIPNNNTLTGSVPDQDVASMVRGFQSEVLAQFCASNLRF
nr:alpha/beta hydrolases superfamily protein [Tanacetum cinerariifolium]